MAVINGTIDRFEDEQAVVITSDGQKIILPKKLLGPRAREGQALKLAIVEDGARTEASAEIAKHLLNEILKGSE